MTGEEKPDVRAIVLFVVVAAAALALCFAWVYYCASHSTFHLQ